MEESTNPVTEVEAAPEASQEVSEELDTEGQESEVVDDEIEDELEGVKVRGKKELVERIKAERLMQADYTRKTQAVAEERRQVQAQMEAWQQQRQAEEEALEEKADLRAYQKQLKQYEAVDWVGWHAQDAEAAQRAFMQYSALKNQATELETKVQSRKQEFTAKQEQQRAQVLQAATDYLRQHVPDWNESTAQSIRQTASDVYGFQPQELAQIIDPRVVRVLRDAQLYRASLAKAAVKPSAANPAPQASPVRKVGGSAPVAKNPDQMSPDEWLKWRESQLRKNRS